MLKKLTQEKQEEILEAGISEFAEHGMQNSSMSAIAKRAGISVGVLYKYYEDKDAFFLACLRRSLSVLENFLDELTSHEDKPLNYARALIESVKRFSSENADHIRMYHEITTNGNNKMAAQMASDIEGMTSKLYTQFIDLAQKNGDVRKDLEPSLFAMFFDNLLMMMQFTYCCPYYRERYKIYRGVDISEEDDLVADQLLRFMESAFTFDKDSVPHGVK